MEPGFHFSPIKVAVHHHSTSEKTEESSLVGTAARFATKKKMLAESFETFVSFQCSMMALVIALRLSPRVFGGNSLLVCAREMRRH